MVRNYKIAENSLTLYTTIPIKTVLELQIYQEENTHGLAIIQAELIDGIWQEVFIANNKESIVTVKDNQNKVIFEGVICKLKAKTLSTSARVSIECCSKTILIDRKKRSRSFQKLGITYMELFHTVMEDYGNNANFLFKTDSNKVVEEPFIQYEETDWSFIKRIASYLGTVIYPKYGDKVLFAVGCNEKKGNEVIEYCDTKNVVKSTYHNPGNTAGKKYVEIEAKILWDIGTKVQYEGINYCVYRRRIKFCKGELSCHYILGGFDFLIRKKEYNEKLVGTRLKGIVKKTEGRKVYLKLNIDEKDVWGYPWMWEPETGNVFYSMPEVGALAVLYFPTGEERDGTAVQTIWNNQCVCNITQNKEMRTACDKVIGLYPKNIISGTEKGKKAITICDEEGISLKSNNAIILSALQEISINGKKCEMVSQTEFICKTTNANIEICRDFNFYAQDGVSTHGHAKQSKVECIDRFAKNEEASNYWQISYSAMAAVPVVDFTKSSEDRVLDLLTCSAVPKITKGRTILALKDTMNGKTEENTRFLDALKSMELYTVKGGHPI